MNNNIEELNAALVLADDENEQAFQKWKEEDDHLRYLREKMTEVGATADMVRKIKNAEGYLAEAFERWCRATTMVELLESQIKETK